MYNIWYDDGEGFGLAKYSCDKRSKKEAKKFFKSHFKRYEIVGISKASKINYQSNRKGSEMNG